MIVTVLAMGEPDQKNETGFTSKLNDSGEDALAWEDGMLRRRSTRCW